MPSIREFISQVRSMNRLLSSDASINDRTIAKEAIATALLLVKQSTDKKKLWSSPNLFTNLSCIEMSEASIAECCEYTSPLTVAKSKYKLPRVAEGTFGLMIQHCSSVDNRKQFSQLSPQRYTNILKLNLKNTDVYYWIYNDHLWITNPDTKAASLSCYPEEDVPTYLLYPNEDCGCKPAVGEDKCKNPLDQPFRAPGYMLKTISDLVAEKLLKTYFNVKEDDKQNFIDEQARNK